MDLTIHIIISNFSGEIEKHIKTITYEAYQNNWVGIELNKGNYVIKLDFVKISECNNCDYFCEKLTTQFKIVPMH
jgi:hypothetical protein